jgi:hypothetical protein
MKPNYQGVIMLKKEGPPIVVEVYTGGRASIFLPKSPTFREKLLSHFLQKNMKNGKLDAKPGRYHFNFTKLNVLNYEAELTPID